MRHIKDAMFEMFQSPHMRMLEAASRHDRIFLCALLLELPRSGVTEACVSHAMRTHEQLCRTHAEPLPPAGAAAAIACRLAASGLLLADPAPPRRAEGVPQRPLGGRGVCAQGRAARAGAEGGGGVPARKRPSVTRTPTAATSSGCGR